MSVTNKHFFIMPRKVGKRQYKYPLNNAMYPMQLTRMFDMKLENVTIKSIEENKKDKETSCINEMLAVFDCLNLHDFDKNMCVPQVQVMEKCYSDHLVKKRAKREERRDKEKKSQHSA